MARVLVTGATGFIGRHLIAHLCEQGYAVRALSRCVVAPTDFKGSVEHVVGNVCDAQFMKVVAEGCDVVLHLAAEVPHHNDSSAPNGSYNIVNVEGTRNILAAAVAARVTRFIFFSTVKVFGERSAACLDESSKTHPETPYGRSKLAAERLVMNYGTSYGLQVVCLRFPPVYGSGHKGNLLKMIFAIDRGWFPPLPILDNRYSLLSITNLLTAVMLCIRSPRAQGQCYIVTDARAYSTTELYETILRALGKPIPRWRIPLGILRFAGLIIGLIETRKNRALPFQIGSIIQLISSAWYSSKKITGDLGYAPTTCFRDEAPDLVALYQKDYL